MQVKPYLEELTNHLTQDDLGSSQSQPTCPSQDKLNGVPNRPKTRALQKLFQNKNAATVAVTFIENEICELCYGNIFREDFDKNHCKNCHGGMHIFPHLAQHNLSFFQMNISVQKSGSDFLFHHRETFEYLKSK